MSMNNNDTTFGSFIETRRKQKQISIRKMAEMLGITPAYLSDIEKNRRYAPDKEKLLEIARILMLSKEEIDLMFDLAGKSKGELPPDIPEYIMDREIVKVALRTANQNNATDEDWKAFIERLKRK